MLLGWCLIYVASTFGVSFSHYLTFPVTLSAMTKTSGAMHVAKITNRRVDKSGQPREYVSHLLRRTYRDGTRVKHETLANLTPLPQAAIDAVQASLAGKTLVVAGEGLEVTGSLPHGHVAAVHGEAKALGLPGLLGPAGRDRGIALALIIARVCRPGSKLATTRWWTDTTLAADLGVADATTDLAEITHPRYPAERLIACRNPALATERARKPLALLDATDLELAKIVAAVDAGRLAGAGKIGIRVGKVVGRYKMAKHYNLDITKDTFAFTHDQDHSSAEAALDGIYVIRTTIGSEQMDAAKVVATYKSLARVERDFRSIKSIDLDLRPIHHWTETRVRAHVFICMLAAYLAWHLRQTWAPLTFTDEQRPDPLDPVAPAQRSQGADRKAATKTTTDDLPARSFTSLLGHLATLTRNHLRVAGHDWSGFDLLAVPTPTGRRAFELIGAPIPLTLK